MMHNLASFSELGLWHFALKLGFYLTHSAIVFDHEDLYKMCYVS